MATNLKKTFFLILFSALISCTNANKSEENLKKLDKIYGYCDNPHREISGTRYEICKAKEAAAGPDGEVSEPRSISEIFGGITNRGNNNGQIAYVKTVNSNLWQGTMDVLSPYSIKLIDSEVGYVETDWIYEQNSPDRRCLIKVQIKSAELISTGVSSTFSCQIKDGENWYNDEKDYLDQEKKLTLTILSKSQEYYNQQNL
jgi:uncharacterized lipoprotein